MHASSLALMREALRCYAPEKARVLDVGAYSVNGSYRELMGGREYVGVDIQPGPNVDIVMPAPYELPFDGGSFDVVVSGQTLEHCEAPWRLVAEMARVLAPGGVLVLVAPGAGPMHRYPVDCWRILPDGMRTLGEGASLKTEALVQITVEPWHDVLGVFRK